MIKKLTALFILAAAFPLQALAASIVLSVPQTTASFTFTEKLNGIGTSWTILTTATVVSGGCTIGTQSISGQIITASVTTPAGAGSGTIGNCVLGNSTDATTATLTLVQQIFTDNFTRADSATVGQGWSDISSLVFGVPVYSIASNTLLVTPSSHVQQYASDILQRPSNENRVNQYIASSAAVATCSAQLSMVQGVRMQGGTGAAPTAGYYGFISFTPGAGQGQVRLFFFNGTTVSQIGSTAAFSCVNAHTYALITSAVGVSPTSLLTNLYDITGVGSFDPRDPLAGGATAVNFATTTDSTAATQQAGSFTLAHNGTAGFSWIGEWEYQDANNAATSYSVTPLGIVDALSGVPTTFWVGANGSLASNVTVTPTVASGAATPATQSVALAAGTSPSNTFTLTSSTIGTSVVNYTNSAALTNAPTLDFVIVGPPVTIAVNDANLYFDTLGWYKDPGNAWIETNATGNKLKVGLSLINPGAVSLGIDVSLYTAAGIAAADYPYIVYAADGGPNIRVQMVSGQRSQTIIPVAALGSHTFVAYFDGTTPVNDSWGNGTTVGANTLRFTGVTAPFASVTQAPYGPYTVYSDKCLMISDSTAAGVNTIGNTGTAISNSQTVSFGYLLSQAISCETAYSAYPGAGYTLTTAANVPPLWVSGGTCSGVNANWWSCYDSVHTKLSGGIFPVSLKYVFYGPGINDIKFGIPAQMAGDVQGALAAGRAAAPGAYLIQMVPVLLNGAAPYAQSQITTGFSAYVLASGDVRAKLLDPGAANTFWNQLATGCGSSYISTDCTHQDAAGAALTAPKYDTLLQQKVTPSNKTNIFIFRH